MNTDTKITITKNEAGTLEERRNVIRRAILQNMKRFHPDTNPHAAAPAFTRSLIQWLALVDFHVGKKRGER